MIRVALIAVVVAAAATACGGHKAPSAAPRHLTDLQNIAQLRAAFNKASHEPRLVLLVSPT